MGTSSHRVVDPQLTLWAGCQSPFWTGRAGAWKEHPRVTLGSWAATVPMRPNRPCCSQSLGVQASLSGVAGVQGATGWPSYLDPLGFSSSLCEPAVRPRQRQPAWKELPNVSGLWRGVFGCDHRPSWAVRADCPPSDEDIKAWGSHWPCPPSDHGPLLLSPTHPGWAAEPAGPVSGQTRTLLPLSPATGASGPHSASVSLAPLNPASALPCTSARHSNLQAKRSLLCRHPRSQPPPVGLAVGHSSHGEEPRRPHGTVHPHFRVLRPGAVQAHSSWGCAGQSPSCSRQQAEPSLT